VIIYTWRVQRYSSREILGVEKGNIDLFIWRTLTVVDPR
jgi:CRISPR-associated protein Cas2